MKASLLLIIIVFACALGHCETSRFTKLKLPHGVSINLPNHWWVVSDGWNSSLLTAVEAKLDLAGIDTSQMPDNTLIALRSVPFETYASIRVDYHRTPPGNAPDVQFPESKLREIDAKIRNDMDKVISPERVLIWEPIQNTTIAGCRASVIHYVRTGQKAPVLTWLHQIELPNNDVLTIHTGFRSTEIELWEPVIQRIMNSLKITSAKE